MQTPTLFFIVTLAIFCTTVAEDETNGLRAVAQSTAEFAKQFLKEVSKDHPVNLITSSLSAQVVLAMAAYGARGTTATEMRSVLRIPSDDELGLSGYKSLIETLNDVKGVNVSLANKIYTAIDFQVKEAYERLTTEKFLSSTQQLNFGDSVAAANTINSWCAQQTNDRITDLIEPGTVDAGTIMVLVNAVYFKGTWRKMFDPTYTTDRPFHFDEQNVKNVPTMWINETFRLGRIPEANAEFLEIPYKGDEVSMIIILPNEVNGLKRFYDNMHQVNLARSLERAASTRVQLFLPKFKIRTTLNLVGPLQQMGMGEMFGGGANFTGIVAESLQVSKVIQKAFIEVNEEGSEAAAATELDMRRSRVVEPEIFRVDRPYCYLIYHRSTNVTLFAGYVRDPTLS